MSNFRQSIRPRSRRDLLISVALASPVMGLTVIPAAAQQPMELPGIVVQGASISARPVRAPMPAPQSAPAQTTAAQAGFDAEPSLQLDTDEDDVDGIPLDQVGSAVTVVTRKQLDQQQVRNGADALRSLPGVSVSQQGTPGNVTVVRIRGAESRHTLVLIDGVEVNSGTDNMFDFSNLTTEDIERIEVLRGSQSGLYGGSAIGGVVNITTRGGRGPARLTLKTEAGTRGTSGVTAQAAGGNDQVWGSLTAHGYQTSGFNISTAGNEDDGTRIRGFAFSGGMRPTENFQIEATLREHNTRGEYDAGNGGTYRGFDVPSDAFFFGETRLRVGSLRATLDTFDKRWIHKFQFSGAQTFREDFDFGVSQATSENSKISYTSTFRLDAPGMPVRHFITGMVERRNESFEQPTAGTPKRTADRDSFVGEIRGEYFNNLFLAASIRHDSNEHFDDFTTWHTSASLKVPGTIFRLHGSVGTGVRYPSFGDLYGTFMGFTPNPDLTPEESLGFDFGVESTLWGGRAIIDVTYFHADLTNEISFNPVWPGPTLINIAGESQREGVEVSGRFQVTRQLTLGGAYTFLISDQPDGATEVRRPRHTGRIDANLAFDNGRGNLNMAAIYNGRMYDVGSYAVGPPWSDIASMDAYWLISAAASYKLQPGVEVFGRVENLLDDRYQEILGYNASGGIGAFAGVKFTLGGDEGIGGGWAK